MNVMRCDIKPTPCKWARYKYNLTTPLGEDGKAVTACEAHIKLSEQAAAEGVVMLENNGILPFKKGTRITLLGVASLDYIKGGEGSGQVHCDYVPNFYEALKAHEPFVSVNDEVAKYYYDFAAPILSKPPVTTDVCRQPEVCPEPPLNIDLIENAAKDSDVAVVVIHRNSGENYDRSAEKGDFYLTDDENKLVETATSLFKHTVVLLNIGGMIDSSWIKGNDKIDAALLVWQGGTNGAVATVDILCGKVNPSGKLVDTFARRFEDYPSADTFNESDDYIDYYEDIYVGYRYFETVPSARDSVVYPFGYGLSYTSFKLSNPTAAVNGDKIDITVKVKNTGDMAGKEVVQAYFSAPQGLLGKSTVELADFAKTPILQPDEEVTVSLSFPINDMASFDDLGKVQKSAYVLEKGDYRFFVGTSCRDIAQTDFVYTLEENIVVKQLKALCTPCKLKKRMLADGTFEALPAAEPTAYNPAPYENTAVAPEGEQPVLFEEVAKGNISLDAFIKQYTDEELIDILGGKPNRGIANTCGFGSPDRLGVPCVMTVDGPAGVRLSPNAGIGTTAWPCATMLACTWNTDLAYKIGKAGGLEAKENGLAIWLTPALNIHRNPLCGRNFEYFSEDPLISGRFAAAKVNGIQGVGTAASAKHFACNNKEKNRYYSDSRISERALREIYLRGFEICVKDSQPHTIMTSYNVINSVRACENYELLEGILRGEWGFEGMVTSDWGVPIDHAKGVLAGNDIRMPWGESKRLAEALENGEISRGHLEMCAKRILQMLLKLD